MADTRALPAPRAPRSSADWLLRLYEAAPTEPVPTGALVALIYLVVSTTVRYLLGDFDDTAGNPFASPFFWLDILNALLFAYVPTAHVLLRRAVLRDLAQLRPVLRGGEDEARDLAERVLSLRPAWLALGGLLAAAFMAAQPAFDPKFWGGSGIPPLGDPLLTFFVLRGALTGWIIGHAIVAEVTLTARYHELGARHVEVDLLDLEPLAPFSRRGLRSALAWIGAVSLVSLFWLGPAAGTTNAWVMCAALVLVVTAFVFTLLGVHRRIRETKRARLAELDAEIRHEQADVMRARDEGRTVDARLADLVAYRTLIEGTREWPVGAPALVRLGLVALLGLGSWLGGALVERLLERALG